FSTCNGASPLQQLTVQTAFLKTFRLLGFLCLFSGYCAGTQSPAAWQYDLRPGDHLVYRYSLERQVTGQQVESASKATFTTHVLVLGEKDGRLSVGFQRNRESAQLLYYRKNGKDALAEEMPKFEQSMAESPAHSDEANEFSVTGEALNFWQA